MKVKSLSCVRLFATLGTVAHPAPPSMGFSGQEYWSGLPFPSPGDLPNPGIKLRSPALQADSLLSEPPGNQKIPSSFKQHGSGLRICFHKRQEREIIDFLAPLEKDPSSET